MDDKYRLEKFFLPDGNIHFEIVLSENPSVILDYNNLEIKKMIISALNFKEHFRIEDIIFEDIKENIEK